MIAFGPVPSRRLGQSLGVNDIPPKHCSYSCIYCQVGPTTDREIERREFVDPDELVQAVSRKVDECREAGQTIETVTFVPDGEPTVDVHLGGELRGLRSLGIPLAVISNGSLLSRRDVRADLAAADLVSVKVDAVDEATWKRVNRPHPRLRLGEVLRGARELAESLPGELLTETMLVAGINDSAASVKRVADFVAELRPTRAYLAVPTRPPAEPGVRPPEPDALVRAHEIFAERLPTVELLATPESGEFGRTGDPTEDLLAILSVHPMTEGRARRYLADAGAEPGRLSDLIGTGRLHRVEYGGNVYLVRRLAPTGGEPE